MSRIDDLLKDQRFRQFMVQNPERAKALVLEMRQKDFGKIPNTEGFLTQAIKQARVPGPFGSLGGTSITAAIPTNREELLDLGKVGIRQIIPDQSGMVGFGANLVGAGSKGLPEPSTEYGKGIESSSNMAQLATLGKEIFPAFKKDLPELINKFRTSPIRKEIKGIEDLKSFLKSSEAPAEAKISQGERVKSILKGRAERETKELAFTGEEKIKKALGEKFKDYNKLFGEGIGNIKSTMTDEDMASILRRSAKKTGAETIPGSPGSSLLKQAERYGPKESKGIIQMKSKVYSASEVQAITKEVLNSVGDNRAKAIFYQELLDDIPQSVKGLKELKELHAPIYKIAKESKILKSSAIKRVSSDPNISKTELKKLKESERGVGTNFIQKALERQSKTKSQNMRLEKTIEKSKETLSARKRGQEQLSNILSQKESDIKNVRFRQASAGAIASLIGAGGLLSRLFNAERFKE